MASLSRSHGTRQNPVTSAGYHLRPGQRVLWESDDGHYLLAYIEVADSTSKRARSRIPHPQVLLSFPNGIQVITPINRVHALPEHGPYRRERQRRTSTRVAER